jgi:hypothetical protein
MRDGKIREETRPADIVSLPAPEPTVAADRETVLAR